VIRFRVVLTTILGIASLGSETPDSPFNVYSVHREPVVLRAPCEATASARLLDFTHRFRGEAYPRGPLSIRDGRHTERMFGNVEWETSVAQEPIELDGRTARLMYVFSNHVGGSGSAAHLLVLRCRRGRWQVIFEAGGAIHPSPGRGYAFSDHGLRVNHFVWLPDDAHCCPSREVVEVYRWRAKRGRFTLVDWSERPISH
jgi:hypothetical protein